MWKWIALGIGLLYQSQASAGVLEPTPGPTPGPTPDGWTPPVWYASPAPTDGAKRRANYAACKAYGDRLESLGYFSDGFGEYLRVVCYTEARGNPNAGSDAYSNAARGPFGLRPQSAWDAKSYTDLSADQIKSLKSLPWAVAQAAAYANRLYSYTDPGQTMTALALRRGWAFPRLVSDMDNSERPELVDRWSAALRALDVPASFADQPIRKLVSRADFPSVAELAVMLGAGPV